MGDEPRKKLPSAPGIPSIALPPEFPPEDSKPPMSVEGEFLFRCLKSVDGKVDAHRSDFEKFKSESLERDYDLSEEVRKRTAVAVSEHEPELKKASSRAGGISGAIAGIVTPALGLLLLGAALSLLARCGVHVPEPVIEVLHAQTAGH